MHSRGYEVQTLRTAQGTECNSNEIINYLHINGIEHAVKEKAANEPMHVAKRMDRTLNKMEKKMFIERGLEKAWWGHAILYGTTICNRCTNATINNKERNYHMFYHKHVDLKEFKLFGCTELKYFPMQNRTELMLRHKGEHRLVCLKELSVIKCI